MHKTNITFYCNFNKFMFTCLTPSAFYKCIIIFPSSSSYAGDICAIGLWLPVGRIKSERFTWFVSGSKTIPNLPLVPALWLGIFSALSSFTVVCYYWLGALSSYSLMTLDLDCWGSWLAACCKAITVLESIGLCSWILLFISSASVVTYLDVDCDLSP